MKCKVTVFGTVQGVGYRPFVARLAEELGLTGSVKNSGGIVTILAEGDEEAMDEMICRLRSSRPAGAKVLEVRVERHESGGKELSGAEWKMEPSGAECGTDTAGRENGSGFQIVESEAENPADIPLPPADLPVCEECLKEMRDPNDRRHGYPFISCVSCGPRYSIVERLPYDRERITMRDFPICPSCAAEYTGRGRRWHAQTISCKECGPQLLFSCTKEGDGGAGMLPLKGEAALARSVEVLKDGGVLALKGIGGYQLACLPEDRKAVGTLRELKRRDRKPFAVMFPDLKTVREYCFVSREEEELITSDARPIVLLTPKGGKAFCRQVGGESRFLGAFLPYTGLHQLLTEACGPLVMTSANVSSEPIVTKDEDIFTLAPGRLGGVAWNTRRIVTPLDDSVASVVEGRPSLIRRSRGYVPQPVLLPETLQEPVFAAGGDLKAAFCLASGNRAYMSQYFGDVANYQVFQEWKRAAGHMQTLLGLRPSLVVCDLHPAYLTSAEMAGKGAGMWPRIPGPDDRPPEKTDTTGRHTRAAAHGVRLLAVQHHHAHAASVMAEHGLDGCIGVAFDGTGFGTDGTVWGGEFLRCTEAGFERGGYLQPVELCGGELSARDARLTALCHLHAAGLSLSEPPWEATDGESGGKQAGQAALVRAALAQHINTSVSSSMGRLFDAVSAMLGIRGYNSYEGECAIALENAAAGALEKGIRPLPMDFTLMKKDNAWQADRSPVVEAVRNAALSSINGTTAAERSEQIAAAALGFHEAVARMTVHLSQRLRKETGEKRIALSGGVFSNVLLLKRCEQLLRQEGFLVYRNEKVPCNDGGLALGQVWIASHPQRR